jgi:hypothetical protein
LAKVLCEEGALPDAAISHTIRGLLTALAYGASVVAKERLLAMTQNSKENT